MTSASNASFSRAREEALLSELPSKLAATLRELLPSLPLAPLFGASDFTRSGTVVSSVRSEVERRPKSALRVPNRALIGSLDSVFDALSWPSHAEPIPLPAALSEPQRALAELLAFRMVAPARYAIPQAAWNRRRWLGIEPPGTLETLCSWGGEERPIWDALATLAQQHRNHNDGGASLRTAVRSLVETLGLSVEQRLDAMADLSLGGYRLTSLPRPLQVEFHEIGCGLGAWATRYADFLARLYSHPGLACEAEFSIGLDYYVGTSVLLCLARAGVAIRPQWDRLLVLSASPESVECVRAIPEDRREKAVLAAATRDPRYATDQVLYLLAAFPTEKLAAFVLRKSGKARIPKREVLERMEEIAREQPIVAEVVRAHASPSTHRLELRVDRVEHPTSLDDLSPSQRKQNQAAAKRWDGTELCPAAILHLVDGDGNPAFDVYCYQVDEAVILRAGTVRVSAQVIQATLECRDPALREALDAVLRGSSG